MDKNKPIELIAQRGSFTYVIVGDESANPEWENKPFKVIEYKAYQDLERKLELAKKALEIYTSNGTTTLTQVLKWNGVSQSFECVDEGKAANETMKVLNEK